MRRFLSLVFCIATAVIGYHIHHSLFFAIVDFVFAPAVWLKWLICHEVSLRIICDAFRFFFA